MIATTGHPKEAPSVKVMDLPLTLQGTPGPFTESVSAWVGLPQCGQSNPMSVATGLRDSHFLGTRTRVKQKGQLVSFSAWSSNAPNTREQEEQARKITVATPGCSQAGKQA
jgi:hypothetical protein